VGAAGSNGGVKMEGDDGERLDEVSGDLAEP
jgi:hypothetical protein